MSTTEIIRDVDSSQFWLPRRGDATESLGHFLVEKGDLPDRVTFDAIVQSSLDIVGQCSRFDGPVGSKTGIVVGYVQSGKTISMTTVASLARDNGCRLVILLAGTTSNLLQQTARERLRPYLQDKPDNRRGWRIRDSVEGARMESLRQDLKEWVGTWRRADIAEERKRPLFVVVMKQHQHLQHLAEQLAKVDLK